MNNDPQSSAEGFFPLPKHIKIHTRKIGANPISPFIPAVVVEDNGDAGGPRPQFQLHWENPQIGLTVDVREQENGHLLADVFCSDAALLNKGAASVALVGPGAEHVIGKRVPLTVPAQTGCSGSTDFGLLRDAVKELGPQIGVVLFLLV